MRVTHHLGCWNEIITTSFLPSVHLSSICMISMNYKITAFFNLGNINIAQTSVTHQCDTIVGYRALKESLVFYLSKIVKMVICVFDLQKDPSSLPQGREGAPRYLGWHLSSPQKLRERERVRKEGAPFSSPVLQYIWITLACFSPKWYQIDFVMLPHYFLFIYQLYGNPSCEYFLPGGQDDYIKEWLKMGKGKPWFLNLKLNCEGACVKLILTTKSNFYFLIKRQTVQFNLRQFEFPVPVHWTSWTRTDCLPPECNNGCWNEIPHAQGPYSQILMTGGRGGGEGEGGGSTEVHILYPKKSQLQNCLPKKLLLF